MAGTSPAMTERLGQTDRRRHQRALPHLVGALRPAGEREIVGDERQSEALGPLQLLEQVDDVGFGVLVEVAGRLVGQHQAR